MSDYFDLLETELRAAVPRATSGESSARRPGRARSDTVIAGIGAAVTVAVAVLALVLVGHGRRIAPQTTSGPPAATASVPTFRDLLDQFVTLRLGQTPADRSWRPGPERTRVARQLPQLTRLASKLHNGDRVFLTVEQLRIAQLGRPAGSYSLRVWVVNRRGDYGSTDFGPNVQYTVLPLELSLPGTYGKFPPSPGPEVWTSIVPDGVGAVRWIFTCQRRACATQPPMTVRVPVRNNLAAATIPAVRGCGAAGSGCMQPATAVWYSSIDGRVLSVFRRPVALIAPPFVLRPARPPAHPVQPQYPPRRVLKVLASTGIGAVRFGGTRAAVDAALNRLFGAPGGRDLGFAQGGCGVDDAIEWVNWTLLRVRPQMLRTLLVAYFYRARLVGYQYGQYGTQIAPRAAAHGTVLSTERGLNIGDTLARGRRLYGGAFTISAAQGGTWGVATPSGRLRGYAWDKPAHSVVSPENLVATIDAGNVGCAALSP